jgi:hypothetical protein
MQIRVLQIKKPTKAKNIIFSLRSLSDAQHDLPVVPPMDWLGKLPGLPMQAKIYLLILHPRKDERPGDWELARAATGILERKAGVCLNWACGYRKKGAVWVVIKPWAVDSETGRRKWFWVTPEALAELREQLA